jgi:hypothetical protein
MHQAMFTREAHCAWHTQKNQSMEINILKIWMKWKKSQVLEQSNVAISL